MSYFRALLEYLELFKFLVHVILGVPYVIKAIKKEK